MFVLWLVFSLFFMVEMSRMFFVGMNMESGIDVYRVTLSEWVIFFALLLPLMSCVWTIAVSYEQMNLAYC